MLAPPPIMAPRAMAIEKTGEARETAATWAVSPVIPTKNISAIL